MPPNNPEEASTDPLEEEIQQRYGEEWDKLTGRPNDPRKAAYVAQKTDEVFKTADIIRKAEERRFIDPLTKLLTKEAFGRALDRIYELIQRGAELDVHLLAIDLDNFKQVNDQLGHPEGDKVLEAIGQVLNDIRKTDVSARIGGEEMMVLVVNPKTENPEIQKLDPVQFADNLRGKITQVVAKYSKVHGQTASIGISKLRVDPNTGKLIPSEQLIEEADIALYFSKNNGRNQVNVYQDGMAIKGSSK